MQKPYKPENKVGNPPLEFLQNGVIEFDLYNGCSLQQVIDWITKNGFDPEYCSFYVEDTGCPTVDFENTGERLNLQYEQQKKEYDRKLAEYNKLMEEYKAELARYEAWKEENELSKARQLLESKGFEVK